MIITNRPSPDFKQMYFYIVLLGSLLFFCGSLFGLITTITNFYYPQSYYKQNSQMICSNQTGMIKDPNMTTRTEKEIIDCVKQNDEMEAQNQRAMIVGGVSSSGVAIFISATVWIIHFQLLRRYENSFSKRSLENQEI